MIEFTDGVGWPNDIKLLNNGRYVKIPIYNSIVKYIIGELNRIEFTEIDHYYNPTRYCEYVSISRIVGVEFTNETVKKYSGVEL